MTDQNLPAAARTSGIPASVAALGAGASLVALFSVAACCILPLLLAGTGISAAGLGAFGTYRWPLTIGAFVAVAAGWALYLRQPRTCTVGANCASPGRSKVTLIVLCLATAVLLICAVWSFIEQPLMRVLGGA